MKQAALVWLFCRLLLDHHRCNSRSAEALIYHETSFDDFGRLSKPSLIHQPQAFWLKRYVNKLAELKCRMLSYAACCAILGFQKKKRRKGRLERRIDAKRIMASRVPSFITPVAPCGIAGLLSVFDTRFNGLVKLCCT